MNNKVKKTNLLRGKKSGESRGENIRVNQWDNQVRE